MGGKKSGGLKFETSLGKKFIKPHLNQEKSGHDHTAVILATKEA
jgi:hypothetical protein